MTFRDKSPIAFSATKINRLSWWTLDFIKVTLNCLTNNLILIPHPQPPQLPDSELTDYVGINQCRVWPLHFVFRRKKHHPPFPEFLPRQTAGSSRFWLFSMLHERLNTLLNKFICTARALFHAGKRKPISPWWGHEIWFVNPGWGFSISYLVINFGIGIALFGGHLVTSKACFAKSYFEAIVGIKMQMEKPPHFFFWNKSKCIFWRSPGL